MVLAGRLKRTPVVVQLALTPGLQIFHVELLRSLSDVSGGSIQTTLNEFKSFVAFLRHRWNIGSTITLTSGHRSASLAIYRQRELANQNGIPHNLDRRDRNFQDTPRS